jgi:hypothetical protein
MMQLLLQKKIQETTMLSEKVEMLEARVASAEEECRGCNSSPLFVIIIVSTIFKQYRNFTS